MCPLTRTRLSPLASLTLVAALAALGAGCAEPPPVRVVDDLDLHLDFFEVHSDLKTPYVRGAEVHVRAIAEDGADAEWRITARDSGVFLADAIGAGETTFHARGAGQTALFATRGRESVRVGAIEVGVPNRAELFAHGPMIVRRRDAALPPVIQVVVGRPATFLVRWLRDGVELHGNGVLSVVTDGALEATPRTTFLFENREWLTVAPLTAGPHRLQVLADGVPLDTFTVVGVPEDAVEAMTLARQSERGAERGDLLHVLAEGFDLEGEPVLGIAPRWELDHIAQAGTGDLFVYEFDGSQARQLFAQTGQAGSVIMVHTGDGFVSSSNVIGCAGGDGGLGWLGVAAALALVARRARRVA